MNGVLSHLPALFILHNFLIFSLHCPLFSLRGFSENDHLFVIDNVYFMMRFGILELQNRVMKLSYAKWRLTSSY